MTVEELKVDLARCSAEERGDLPIFLSKMRLKTDSDYRNRIREKTADYTPSIQSNS